MGTVFNQSVYYIFGTNYKNFKESCAKFFSVKGANYNFKLVQKFCSNRKNTANTKLTKKPKFL
jgi:hypothetical protein